MTNRRHLGSSPASASAAIGFEAAASSPTATGQCVYNDRAIPFRQSDDTRSTEPSLSTDRPDRPIDPESDAAAFTASRRISTTNADK